jgi:hypothetical protein
VTEICAVLVVLTQIRVAGIQAAALALVLSGVLLAMWSQWQDMSSLIRRYDNRSWQLNAGSTSTSTLDAVDKLSTQSPPHHAPRQPELVPPSACRHEECL